MIESRYDPNTTEKFIYERWEKSGLFNPDNLSLKRGAKPFTIIMPPPNANGSLHAGHAMFVTLEDILTRFHRMKGFRTLWLPGADHAGFETQVVFDKKLDKEGRNRFAMSRDELYKAIFDFTQTNKKVMEGQLRKLGASCDWSRETFMLDKKIISGVYDTFEKLYKDGLAYRDLRVVNWCPKHRTALSDLEVKHVEKTDPLYFIKYGPLTLATVRPETKFGDTALAVHPRDKRYKNYIGKQITAKGLLGPLTFTVIADEAIDPSFGTGVVKVTPAHDIADFEIWQRNKDRIAGPKIVIDETGRLTGDVGEFKGMKVAEAREKIAEKMKEIGILEKVDLNYVHQIATCYKCGSTLEPIPKPQWFISTKPLAKKAIQVARQRSVNFYPSRSKKVYIHWLENIRDWNISRQIVWGIRIPAWYCKTCQEKNPNDWRKSVFVGKHFERCPQCKTTKGFEQDSDVFDTWFSSGQWPFLTLDYPKGKDYKTFYPTQVMETAYDILFFWVSRMIMLGLYRTGKVPFKHIYLHGLVRDKDRQKMSKSKGNVVDPLGIIETYGADALRMALVVGNTAGNDIVISEEKIRGYRNFSTKMWNAARFVLLHKPSTKSKKRILLTAKDKQYLAELARVRKRVTKHLEQYEFHRAAENLYHYFWHTFADKIIEEAKPRLEGTNEKEKHASYHTLETILVACITMLHPFMPFITEAIYEHFDGNKGKTLLMTREWTS